MDWIGAKVSMEALDSGLGDDDSLSLGIGARPSSEKVGVPMGAALGEDELLGCVLRGVGLGVE